MLSTMVMDYIYYNGRSKLVWVRRKTIFASSHLFQFLSLALSPHLEPLQEIMSEICFSLHNVSLLSVTQRLRKALKEITLVRLVVFEAVLIEGSSIPFGGT